MTVRPWPGWAAVVLLALAVTTACDRGSDQDGEGASSPTGAPGLPGGSVRVAVWAPPDPDADHLGGAAVRALVLPQLFVAQPDGTWSASLVEPGTDRQSEDATSASFRLRPGARWSNGAPITADDLRRTRDERFVAAVEDPDANGTIIVRFTQPFPGWRRLWSGIDSVAAPAPDVWGGPFVVRAVTPGLETVLARNDGWRGGAVARIDELRLQLVPDVLTTRQLMVTGAIDVADPPAYLARTRGFEASSELATASARRSGWWVGLMLSERLSPGERRGMMATVDRSGFVGTLLRDEAVLLQGFAGPEDATWASVRASDPVGLRGRTVPVVAAVEEPMTSILHRAMSGAAAEAGGQLELKAAEYQRSSAWVAAGDYQAAVMLLYDGPHVCWSCRWDRFDGELAGRADAGDEEAVIALEGRLRDEARLLPLWRPRTLIAWRPDGVQGVRANGYALSAAWNAWEWSRPAR